MKCILIIFALLAACLTFSTCTDSGDENCIEFEAKAGEKYLIVESSFRTK
jgi:hypothetical protein